MILSNTEILGAVRSRELLIDPFDEQYLEPASYDMRVGSDARALLELLSYRGGGSGTYLKQLLSSKADATAV